MGKVTKLGGIAMALSESKGNMYEWCTHMHSHLRGKCSHGCSYCYVQAMEKRWGSGAFSGELRFKEDELDVRYGEGKKIFIEHQNDLFADDVKGDWISSILEHCRNWPFNEYIFQTKNPSRMLKYMWSIPERRIVGVTIESDIFHEKAMGMAPLPVTRFEAFRKIEGTELRFVTIEPIMRFNLKVLAEWIKDIRPTFVNIGADSKGSGMDEPTRDEVLALAAEISGAGIEVRNKHNLGRLVGK